MLYPWSPIATTALVCCGRADIAYPALWPTTAHVHQALMCATVSAWGASGGAIVPNVLEGLEWDVIAHGTHQCVHLVQEVRFFLRQVKRCTLGIGAGCGTSFRPENLTCKQSTSLSVPMLVRARGVGGVHRCTHAKLVALPCTLIALLLTIIKVEGRS